MSEVAGKLATRPARSCSRSRSAAGACLLGGVPGVAPRKVMVIGGGVVGMNARSSRSGMQAEVYVYDRNIDRLRELEHVLGYRASTVFSSTLEIEQRLPEMDLVIGAVLVHGARRRTSSRASSSGS
jgi:alanine dehydrogenase